MRITGGSARGRRLYATRSPAMRPTTDMARRTVFDILGDRVLDAVVLDLFAGAGTLGIDALSRGAARATFVERDRQACAVFERNLAAAGFRDRAVVARSTVERYLSQDPPTPADLVFVDPPYGAGLPFVGRILDALVMGSWVRSEGTVVVEAETGQIRWPEGLDEIRARRFGRTQMSVAIQHAGSENSHLSRDV